MAEVIPPLSQDAVNQVILAAATMTGPADPENLGAWDGQVASNAKMLASMMNEKSNIAKTIQTIHTAKKFMGTILAAGVEKTSTRGLVYLKTRPTDRNPLGIEDARTERTDSSEDALAFITKLKTLKGHKVLVFIEMQENEKTQQKYRVLQHVVDLGLDPEFEAEDAKAQVAEFRASKGKR